MAGWQTLRYAKKLSFFNQPTLLKDNMLATKTITANPVRVQLNTTNAKRPQWARIIDAKTGRIVHTGQPKYIRKVAKTKYNLEVIW